jgi:hypothetical protein
MRIAVVKNPGVSEKMAAAEAAAMGVPSSWLEEEAR